MSYTDDGKIYRNIQEQVQKNKDDIAALRDVNDIGVNMVGHVDTVDDLPDPSTYTGNYGDMYAAGSEPPYTFYVFTRPMEGNPYPSWFSIGQIQLVGPQGPQGETGPQGPQGIRGSLWVSRTDNPPVTAGNRAGDQVLRADNGDVFMFNGVTWVKKGNIRGPQGIQGPRGIQGPKGDKGDKGEKGQTGDPGNFIHIVSSLASADLLPNPTTIDDPSIAYLVGTTKDLYIIEGASQQSQVWSNIGPLNVATYVTVGGEFQSSWDADTKLDKSTVANSVYAVNAGRGQTMVAMNSDPVARSIPTRSAAGTMKANAATLGPTPINEEVNDKFVVNLGQLPKFGYTEYLLISNPCFSNVMYLSEKNMVKDTQSPVLDLRINPNGDQSPIWMVSFNVGTGWSGLQFTNNNTVYWIDGQEPSFESGKIVTIMLWPAYNVYLEDYSPGNAFDGDLMGIVAYASGAQ